MNERVAALKAELADTKRQLELTEGSYNSDMRNAIAEHDKLQAENAMLSSEYEIRRQQGIAMSRAMTELQTQVSDLREGIRKADILYGALTETDPTIPSARRHNAIKGYLGTRQRLATDHGLPLPGAGEGGE